MSQPWVVHRGRRLESRRAASYNSSVTLQDLQSGCSDALQPHRLNHHLRHGDPDPLLTGGKRNTFSVGAWYNICRAGLPHRTGSGLDRGLSETMLLVKHTAQGAGGGFII